MTYIIKQLDKLIKGYVEPTMEIIEYSTKRLTAPGENYGSLILAVEVLLRSQSNTKETLHLVAKLLPENEWIRKMFKVEVTFKKEMEFYRTIVPTLKEFLKENHVNDSFDLFPKYYGGRISLNDNSTDVDEGATILLENLVNSGFRTVGRRVGFNLEETQLLLKDLAVFHAVPIALKIRKPGVFNEKVLPHINRIPMFDDLELESKQVLRKEVTDMCEENPEIAHLVERVGKSHDLGEYNMEHPSNFDVITPFSTVIHNDFWVNNAMLKYENNNVAAQNKMVDFQVIEYGSSTRDVLFFLFTSVQMPVIKKHYDSLLKLYHDKFVDTLSALNCPLGEYSFKHFEKELQTSAMQFEFFHVIGMLKPIFANPEKVKDLKEFSEQDMASGVTPQEQKERAWYIMDFFAKKNWI